jgi:EmrB/QacA subfamily drug resistance transporter
MPSSPEQIYHPASKKSALIVTTLSFFIVSFMGSAVNIALPSISKEFKMDAVLLSWVATTYLLASAISILPLARAGDICGRKKFFLWGCVLFTVWSFLLGISTSATMLLTLRVLQGMGAAMIFGTGTAILISVFPAGERGKVLGINVAAVYVGLSIGPFLGGLLTYHLGWRSIFISVVPVGLVILLSTLWTLKGEWAEAKGERIDLTGTALYGFTLITIIYGFSLLPEMGGAGLIALGSLGILAFVKWETRVTSPLLDVRLFMKNRVFAFSNLAALINYSATFAISFLLSLYLQYLKGFTPQQAGLVLVSQPVVQAIFSPFAGRLSDRMEPRIVASIGMSLTALGLVLLTFLSEGTVLPYIVTSLILIGFGLALFSSPNTNAVMGSVEKRFYGVASAALGTMRITGNMFSMGIVALLFSIYIGRAQITAAHYLLFLKSLKVTYLLFAILCFGGIFASLARGRRHG